MTSSPSLEGSMNTHNIKSKFGSKWNKMVGKNFSLERHAADQILNKSAGYVLVVQQVVSKTKRLPVPAGEEGNTKTVPFPVGSLGVSQGSGHRKANDKCITWTFASWILLLFQWSFKNLLEVQIFSITCIVLLHQKLHDHF